jgi:hypothetical protein
VSVETVTQILLSFTSVLRLFKTANLLTIDASTDLTNGPAPAPVPALFQIPITFNGYGLAFLALK